jgi:phosphotransferase system enzyme I (PtsI)
MIDEVGAAIENGAEEIGLMRTEYLVMGRNEEIDVAGQVAYYRQLAERAYPMAVTFRLLDIGSDKLADDVAGPSTSPLGLRGLRLLLERPAILAHQLEAILRASSMKNLRIMLPMVTSVEEMIPFREILDEVRARLRAEGVLFDEHIRIGAMIETPAAAVTADALATVFDFFSLGTNDLAQYTLAVDRSDDAMARYYDDLHPAVLRLIRATALAAERAGIPVTICGELAANPLATEILIGIGIRRFSVQPLALGALKMRIRSVDAASARERARVALRLGNGEAVRQFIRTTVGAEAGTAL